MFKVAVFSEVESPIQDEPASFFREMELPFPPYIGLSLSDAGWASGPITSVDWNVSGSFICYVAPDDSLTREDDPTPLAESDYLQFKQNVLGWRRYGRQFEKPTFISWVGEA